MDFLLGCNFAAFDTAKAVIIWVSVLQAPARGLGEWNDDKVGENEEAAEEVKLLATCLPHPLHVSLTIVVGGD